METTASTNRIHPLMAAAAVSVTLFSLVGAAAVAGLLPTSHGKNEAITQPLAQAAGDVAGANGALAGQAVQGAALAAAQPQLAAAPVQSAPVAAAPAPKPVRHEASAPRYREPVRHAERPQVAHTEPRYDDRPAPAPAPAPAPQNSALGIGIGAVVGGLIGNQVGGGSGKKIATVAGAIGGGYLGNEIAKRNQQGQ